MKMRKIMSVILAAALCVSFVLPALADGMTVSAPKYTRVESTVDPGGYDAFSYFEAPVNGEFKDVVTWGGENNYGAFAGTFKSEVNVAGGAGKSVTFIGAVYDALNRLVNIAVDTKAAADATDTLSVSNDIAAGETYKNFIWDNMSPVATLDAAPEILYFYCDDPNTVKIAWYNLGGTYTVWKNGVQVADPALSTSLGWSVLGKHSGYIYTDTSAVTGDTYVIKNNGVASETLVADFTSGASVTLGKYVSGRNMEYLRNDNAQWYHNSVSRHMNIEGTECDAAVYKSYTSGGNTSEKWSNFYFKFDQDYLSGTGNTLDVTINYFDHGTEPMWLYYFSDSNPSSMTRVAAIANMTDTNTWKTVTTRISGVTLAADAPIDGNYQLRVIMSTGAAISAVSAVPYIDTTVSTLRAANTYTDGIELRWTMASESGINGYTIKRDGNVIATNYRKRVYYDRNLTADTAYSYTVTAETANGLGTESSVLNTRTESEQFVKIFDMTLPVNEATQQDDGTGVYNGVDYTVDGLTFRLCNNNRWRNSQTLTYTRGGEVCRATVSQARSSGSGWDPYVKWVSGRNASKMQFRVDNSILSGDQRNVRIEFDYFDDSNQYMTADGNAITLHYLKYDGSGTPVRGAKYVTTTNTDTWKTASITIDDAQFTHNGNINDNNGQLYDFQIGMEIGRGGFACRNIKVYAPAANPMPEHEIYAEMNADGTALNGTLELSSAFAYESTTSYDKNILFSGTAGRDPVEGKHYMYNQELTEYNGGAPGWRRWQNSFWFKVPDDFLYGNDYTKLEIEVEYYVPTSASATSFRLMGRNSSGETTFETISAAKGAWTTKVFTIVPSSGMLFSNGYGSGIDFRMNYESAQGYIHKVTIRKDIIED